MPVPWSGRMRRTSPYIFGGLFRRFDSLDVGTVVSASSTGCSPGKFPYADDLATSPSAMNPFRMLFLVVVLAASVSIAIVNLVPDVVARVSDGGLDDRAQLEAMLLHERELTADLERRAGASQIARAEPLVRALSAPPSFGGPSPGPMFRQASNALWNRQPSTVDGLFLLDAGANVLDIRRHSDQIDATLLERSQAAGVLETVAPATSFVALNGVMYAVTSVPVVANRSAVGAVVLVQTYDDAHVASRRTGPGASTVWFADREILASNASDPEIEARVASVVRATTAQSTGVPSALRAREVFDLSTEFGGVRVLAAPVRVGPAMPEGVAGVTAMAVIEAPVPATNPFAAISNSGVLDESSMRFWVTIALGLIVFFGGLFLLDTALERSTRRLSRIIRDNATANDPPLVDTATLPSWLRDVAEAFNTFLEAYRAHTPSARRSRRDSGSYEALPSGSSPLVLPRGEAALEASGESMWTRTDDATETVDLAPDEFERLNTGLLRLNTGEEITVGELLEDRNASAPASSASADPFEGIPSGPQEEGSATTDAVKDAGTAPEVTDAAPIIEFEEDLDDAAAEAGGEVPSFEVLEEPPVASDDDAAPEDDEDAEDDEAEAYLREVSGGHGTLMIHGLDLDSHSSIERPIAPMDSDRTANWDVAVDDATDGEAPEEAEAADATETTEAAEAVDATETTEEAEAADATEATEAAEAADATETTKEAAPSSTMFDEGSADFMDEVSGSIEAALSGPFKVLAPRDETSIQVVEADETEAAPAPVPEAHAEATEAALETANDMSALIAQIAGPPSSTPTEADDDTQDEAAEVDDETEALIRELSEQVEAEDASEAVNDAEAANLLDEEADDERDAPPEDAGSKTVPRVSIDDLAGAAGQRSGQASDLLAAAEARLRALRPELEANAEAHRALYDRFVRAKESCHEDTSRLTYERFVAKLERNRDALTRRYQCTDVKFDVAIRDGRVTLKATPVR